MHNASQPGTAHNSIASGVQSGKEGARKRKREITFWYNIADGHIAWREQSCCMKAISCAISKQYKERNGRGNKYDGPNLHINILLMVER